MATPFACSYNMFYIYQAFIFRFHKAPHSPSLLLSLSVHLSLSFWGTLSSFPNVWSFPAVWRCWCFLLAFTIHGAHPVTISTLMLTISTLLQLCCLLPPSDHYCIASVASSGDQYWIDMVVPSSDHCRIETVPPSSDHYGSRNAATGYIPSLPPFLPPYLPPPVSHDITKIGFAILSK